MSKLLYKNKQIDGIEVDIDASLEFPLGNPVIEANIEAIVT